MPEISRFYGIIIRVYYRDHPPAHFHAIYGEYEALVEVETGRIYRGELPRTAGELVNRWRETPRCRTDGRLESSSGFSTHSTDCPAGLNSASAARGLRVVGSFLPPFTPFTPTRRYAVTPLRRHLTSHQPVYTSGEPPGEPHSGRGAAERKLGFAPFSTGPT